MTLYLPGASQVSDARSFIKNEIDSSNNIKSKETRKNVQMALQALLRTVRDTKTFPENGVVLFAGMTREDGFILEVVESPVRICKKMYVCGKAFLTSILKQEMTDSSCVEGVRKVFEPRIKSISTVFVAGSGNIKNEFLTLALDHQSLLGDVYGHINQNGLTVAENGIAGMLSAQKLTGSLLDRTILNQEISIMTQLKRTMEDCPQKVRYGEKEVKRVFLSGMVQEIYLSDEQRAKDILGNDFGEHSVEKMHLISGRTSESQDLVNVFEGIVAILYYPIDDEILSEDER